MPDVLHEIQSAPIRSAYADDPDFQEVLVEFMAGIQERPAMMRALFEAGAIDDLRVLAHQLKGAGGGYGFPGLSTAAAELELASKELDGTRIAAALERLAEFVSRISV